MKCAMGNAVLMGVEKVTTVVCSLLGERPAEYEKQGYVGEIIN